jgi:methylated-DNA-[protein]-cysteine S-methyltransferase
MRLHTVLPTPIGGLGVGVAAGKVTEVSFGAPLQAPFADLDPVLQAALDELAEYFDGARTGFTVPSAFTRGSDFERAVWEQITSIPYGQMKTYGAIARAVGEPGGAQAVGLACNRNPLPVIVPCHRVVGANGKLVGFGGGLPRKRFLLQLEAKVAIERGIAPVQ